MQLLWGVGRKAVPKLDFKVAEDRLWNGLDSHGVIVRE
jgi:hypothetical protein